MINIFMANQSYHACRECGALCKGFYCPNHKHRHTIIEDEKIKEILQRARKFEFDEEEMKQIERGLRQN